MLHQEVNEQELGAMRYRSWIGQVILFEAAPGLVVALPLELHLFPLVQRDQVEQESGRILPGLLSLIEIDSMYR